MPAVIPNILPEQAGTDSQSYTLFHGFFESLLLRESENTIASAKGHGNEKNGRMIILVLKDVSQALEKKDNEHKFISNSMVDMVKKYTDLVQCI